MMGKETIEMIIAAFAADAESVREAIKNLQVLREAMDHLVKQTPQMVQAFEERLESTHQLVQVYEGQLRALEGGKCPCCGHPLQPGSFLGEPPNGLGRLN